MSNVLVTYFSASGTTKDVAEKIAKENGYDIFENEAQFNTRIYPHFKFSEKH